MKNREIRAAYDRTLPSGETKEELLQRLLAAASEPQAERKIITMKTIKKRYIVLVAALIALALSCTAMASGVLGETFGLWLGDRKVALDKLTPVAFDLEGFLAEYPTGIVDQDRVFRDTDSFTRATGMTLPGAEELQMTDIALSVSNRWRTGHLCMTIGTGDGEAQMNGMFLLEGHAQEMYGYGVENTRADEVYEYAEGRKAYFIKGDEIIQVYFVEDGVMFQMFVENSRSGKELGKEIVDRMSGTSEN